MRLFIILFALFPYHQSVPISHKPIDVFLQVKSNNSGCNIASATVTYENVRRTIILVETSHEIMVSNLKVKTDQSSSLHTIDLQDNCFYQSIDTSNPEFPHRMSLRQHASKVSGFIALQSGMFSIPQQLLVDGFPLIVKPYEGTNRTCGTHTPPQKHTHLTQNEPVLTRSKRATFSYVNAQIQNRYVELYVLIDNLLFIKMGSSESTLTGFAVELVNDLNAYFRQFGIHIVLSGLEIWQNGQNVTMNDDAKVALADFSFYRRTSISVKHDAAMMLTNHRFIDNYAGMAYMGGLCKYTFSTGIITDYYSVNALDTSTTMAHELGHNFGIDHDTVNCTCEGNTACMMSAVSSGVNPMKWSDCSIAQMNTYLPSGLTYCLDDVPNLSAIVSTSCGNGVVEAGEDCDPGHLLTNTTCCNPTTCKFQPGAQCASGRCCNLATCQLQPYGTTCSPIVRECDLTEYCSGSSELCPTDFYAADGTSCDSGQGTCSKGFCGSNNLRCKQVYGSLAVEAIDYCFQQNVNNDTHGVFGYCTYSVTSQNLTMLYYNYNTCAPSNYRCGVVHCQNTPRSDVFPDAIWPFMEYFQFKYTYSSGLEEYCVHPRHDVRLSQMPDPGLVPNGAICGTNQVCLNGACTPLSTILPNPNNCSDHGTLNNAGSCHCDYFYTGTDCGISDYSSCGGSPEGGSPCLSNKSTTASKPLTTTSIQTTTTKETTTSEETTEKTITTEETTVATEETTTPKKTTSDSAPLIATSIPTTTPTSLATRPSISLYVNYFYLYCSATFMYQIVML